MERVSTSRLITDLKSEFEGGSSLSVDWFNLLRRGAENMLDKINPETLKRRVPLYGGFARGLWIYYCPPDVDVPSAIYSNLGVLGEKRKKITYRPAGVFYDLCEPNTFTMEFINGGHFLVVRHMEAPTTHILDEMDDPTGFTGVELTINDRDFVFQSAALEGIFPENSSGLSLGAEEITNGNFTLSLDGWSQEEID